MPMTEEQLPIQIGDVIDGKYRIERILGQGGMGVVVRATHLQLEQPVALKFVLPRVAAMDAFRERFLREARASSRLRSEHVARVYDVGTTEGGLPYLVMELLEGNDLATLMLRAGPMAVADAVEYVVQACEAIVEAHDLGIVHRDLKPANLFVTRRPNGAPLLKVLDFGISKQIGPGAMDAAALTQSTAVLGSPLYMAPEQLRSARAVDARSDIWALGIITYELLTGKVPFHGETLTELCLKVVSDPAAPPSQVRRDLPPELVSIVMRCLEKDPSARYSSVAMLAAALEPFSSSAARGVTERVWRSLAETMAPLDDVAAPAMNPANATDAPNATENSTWGGTRPSGIDLPRRRSRVVVAAALVIAAVAGAGLFALHGAGSSPAPAAVVGSPAPPRITEPEVDAAAPAPQAEAEVDAGAPAKANSPPARRPPRRATQPAGSASAPAPRVSASQAPAEVPRTSPNGAPILH
ncbi:serine/threonine protein kinase [Pendulispora brunnea]|uniref:Serine/threonine protein kinase n=1 Tax=Pendulispora brunnea TaxID=2905690 RepID=A0ABZ2KRU6_9BACT